MGKKIERSDRKCSRKDHVCSRHFKEEFIITQVAHRAVTDSCNRSVSHTCETDPYQACYISVLQEFCLELLCFTGFGKSLFHRSGTDLLSFCNT
jgi:hypothetical protein